MFDDAAPATTRDFSRPYEIGQTRRRPGDARQGIGARRSTRDRPTRALAIFFLVMTGVLSPPAAKGQAADPCHLGDNCVLNPSLERDRHLPRGLPDDWSTNVWGGGDEIFATSKGRNSPTAATVTIPPDSTARDAKWLFREVPVLSGQYYVFSNWYKSDSPTQVCAYFRGGATPFKCLSDVPASKSPETWTRLKVPGFVVPEGAVRMTVAQSLTGPGKLTTDDYTLVLEKPPLFPQGLVSLTFDDGWKAIYDNAIPILNEAGIKSTQYIYTDALKPGDRFSRNMTIENVLAMQRQGHEIAGHTKGHVDLVNVAKDAEARHHQIAGSRSDLTREGVAAASFAYPYGKYNDEVKALVANSYIGARTVDRGYNTRDADPYSLKSQVVLHSTKAGDVIEWIDYAVANRLWLIITFHRVEPTPAECTNPGWPKLDPLCTDVATLRAVAEHLRHLPKGTTATVREVLERDELWASTGEAAAGRDTSPVPVRTNAASAADPPSTFAGEQVALERVMTAAYRAGFRTESLLLPAVCIAIGESDLWRQARNWQPAQGFRPGTDAIGVEGPAQVWSTDRRQMHSDRGIWQISSYSWPSHSDVMADDPVAAAAAVFAISEQGKTFTPWDSFKRGRAQSHYDRAYEGWPAIRPLVKDFLARVARDEVTGRNVISGDPPAPVATPLGPDPDIRSVPALRSSASATQGPAQAAVAELLGVDDMAGSLPTESLTASIGLNQEVTRLLVAALQDVRLADTYVSLIKAAARAREEGALRLALTLLKHANLRNEAIAFNMVETLPPNDKAAILQTFLHSHGYYRGPIDGLLTRSTLRAAEKFCVKESVPSCQRAAMPPELLSAMISALSRDDSAGSKSAPASN